MGPAHGLLVHPEMTRVNLIAGYDKSTLLPAEISLRWSKPWANTGHNGPVGQQTRLFSVTKVVYNDGNQ